MCIRTFITAASIVTLHVYISPTRSHRFTSLGYGTLHARLSIVPLQPVGASKNFNFFVRRRQTMQRGFRFNQTTLIFVVGALVCLYLGRISVTLLPLEVARGHNDMCDTEKHNKISHEVDRDMDKEIQRMMGMKKEEVQEKKAPEPETKVIPGEEDRQEISRPVSSVECLGRSGVVRDNERAGQRGFHKTFYYSDCSEGTVGAGRNEWKICKKGINADSMVFSFGISAEEGGPDLSFEMDMLKFDATVVIFDPLPAALEVLKKTVENANGDFKEKLFEKKFIYHQLGLWERDGSRGFTSKGIMTEDGKGEMILPVVRFSTVLCMFAPPWIDIMKIDFPR